MQIPLVWWRGRRVFHFSTRLLPKGWRGQNHIPGVGGSKTITADKPGSMQALADHVRRKGLASSWLGCNNPMRVRSFFPVSCAVLLQR